MEPIGIVRLRSCEVHGEAPHRLVHISKFYPLDAQGLMQAPIEVEERWICEHCEREARRE